MSEGILSHDYIKSQCVSNRTLPFYYIIGQNSFIIINQIIFKNISFLSPDWTTQQHWSKLKLFIKQKLVNKSMKLKVCFYFSMKEKFEFTYIFWIIAKRTSFDAKTNIL